MIRPSRFGTFYRVIYATQLRVGQIVRDCNTSCRFIPKSAIGFHSLTGSEW